MRGVFQNFRSRLRRGYRRLRGYSARTVEGLSRQQTILRRLSLVGTRFVAVTGSAGKTTAARLTHAILATRGDCHALGGRNSTYASTLAVHSLPRSCKFCVQEIGAKAPGMIAEHVRVLRPDIGIVTTIGGDHYKAFRSLEATAKEKGRLVESLPRNGVAVLNADDPLVIAMAARTRARVLTFGLAPSADVRASAFSGIWPNRLRLTVIHSGESVDVFTLLIGEHWVPAVLAAIACGLACGLDLRACAAALAGCGPMFGRFSEHTGAKGQVFVMDHVKAPVWTIPTGLKFVSAARAPRKTIVLGTLSDYAGAMGPRYRRTARQALDVADRVVFAGPQSGHVERLRKDALGDRLFNFTTAHQASSFLAATAMPGELIYIKASIVDHLERIMLSQLREVVCWRERCRVQAKSCPACWRFSKPSPPPFGTQEGQHGADRPAALDA
ncbi:MAG: Mur ligase family protein [Methyloceanibacter sp.]